MIHAIIGHRGTGKTKFLSRVQEYYAALNLSVCIFDLDQEIVTRGRRSIEQIFSEHGEQYFRRVEIDTFAEILNEIKNEKRPVYIAVGAGFKGDFPLNIKVLWLKRPTDKTGRIFLNRPRLDAVLAPLEEYNQRAQVREKRFQTLFHKEIAITEGYSEVNAIEPILLGLAPYNLKAGMTVLPHVFANEIRLEDFIADKLLLGVEFFELRDDLLSVAQMERFATEVSRERLVFSFRTRDHKAIRENWRWAGVYDWALELGACPFGEPPILSLHKRANDESVDEAATRLVSHKAEHYKLAVVINDLVELWQGHQWYLEDPNHRSFLPVSPDGRWDWYRLAHGQNMKIKFVRESLGSAPDQPMLFDWMRVQNTRTIAMTLKKSIKFAAILGDPVAHSRTPFEQEKFFAEREWPVLAIRLAENDLNEINFGILHRLGLQAAAVTSPLKEKAFKLCRETTPEARALSAVNTLRWDARHSGWSGANTDLIALKAIFSKMALPLNVAVWGGGGTLSSLKQILPMARFFSARTGLGAEEFAPQMVIWAIGRGRISQCKYPPESWHPNLVFDLNYGEDSPGREYAQVALAQYISGLEMFKLQAQAQREFWRDDRVSEYIRPTV